MAIRNIRVDDDPILRKISRPVTDFNDRLFDLLDDMKETMYKSGGVGLAAPQVGVLRRVVIVEIGDKKYEMINPEIIETLIKHGADVNVIDESREITKEVVKNRKWSEKLIANLLQFFAPLM